MRLRVVRAAVMLAALVAAAALAQTTRTQAISAQQARKANNSNESEVEKGTVAKITDWIESHRVFDWVKARDKDSDAFWLRPRIGGITRGAGFALGPDVIVPILPYRLELHAFGALSTRQYRLGLAELVSPHLLGDRLQLSAGATYRYFPQEDFWGLGAESVGPRTNYLMESREYKATARFKVGPFGASATAGSLQPRIDRGRDPRFPSTERTFLPQLAPGLLDRPQFRYASAFVELDTRDNPRLARRGTHVRFTGTRYFDRSPGRFSFDSLEGRALQVVPIFGEWSRLVFHARAVSQKPERGGEVPFYLMPWLGGDDSIRSADTYRYRDRNLAQFNAEYQWEVFEYMDVAIFADVGTVAPRFADLARTDLKTAYGIGVRFHTDRQFVLRIDAALGGRGGDRRVVLRLRPSF